MSSVQVPNRPASGGGAHESAKTIRKARGFEARAVEIPGVAVERLGAVTVGYKCH